MRFTFLSIIFMACLFTPLHAQSIIIQENEIGFCAVDGAIMTSVSGYTGAGYADTDRGVGKSISWSVNAETAGMYRLNWRYGNGGGTGDRPARLLINGAVYIESINFPHTGVWTNWSESDTVVAEFAAGYNQIRLEAHSQDGLGNYDYMTVIGEGISPTECVPAYTLVVNQNEPEGGMVSFEPVQKYYNEGTAVTLRAQAESGYFFQSWSGDVTSADSVFTFLIRRNVVATAIFLPEGTTMDSNIIGYATVQDDQGTPYLVTGGSPGATVEAKTVAELQQYLGSAIPLVVTVTGKIQGTEDIKVTSNKTLLGVGEEAHLQGTEIEINGARNVIVQTGRDDGIQPGEGRGAIDR